MRESNVISIGGPSYTPRLHSPTASEASSSSSCYSPTSEASTSSFGRTSIDTQQLQYARSMANHTALMWQRERLAIEKAKLDGTWKGDVTSRTNGSAKPVPGPQDEEALREIEANNAAAAAAALAKSGGEGEGKRSRSRRRSREVRRDLPTERPAEKRWWFFGGARR